jgi:hypothetical protein
LETRILFKGREYPGVENMPADVRQAYEQAMARFADADHNGIPDILEGAAAADSDNVVVIKHSSLTVNGRTVDGVGDLPAPMRRLVEQAMASLGADAAAPGAGPTVTVSGDLAGFLDAFLRVFLAMVAAAIVVGAVILMLRLDASLRSQGGRFFVAGAAVVLLALVESRFAWLERRRRGWFDATASQRYGLRSLLFLLAAVVVLGGLALLLP